MTAVHESRVVVRGYECGQDRTVHLPKVLSYLEHARWEWILRPELGLVDLLEQGHFFVVHHATLALLRTFGTGTEIAVRAVLRRVGRVHCEVEQDLVRSDGVRLAHARITAVWIGPSGRMARVPDATRQRVTNAPLALTRGAGASPVARRAWMAPPERALDGTLHPAGRAPSVPDDALTDVLVVRPSDCDMFGHVNNANYLRYFEDAVGAHAVHADLEYRGQARAGERLALRRWNTEAGPALALQRERATLCAGVLRLESGDHEG